MTIDVKSVDLLLYYFSFFTKIFYVSKVHKFQKSNIYYFFYSIVFFVNLNCYLLLVWWTKVMIVRMQIRVRIKQTISFLPELLPVPQLRWHLSLHHAEVYQIWRDLSQWGLQVHRGREIQRREESPTRNRTPSVL